MNNEYSITTFSDCFTNIVAFIKSSGFTVVEDSTDLFVFALSSYYIEICNSTDYGIGITCSTSYNNTIDWYKQDGCPHFANTNSGYDYYFSVIPIGTSTYTLYCNSNTTNIEISLIDNSNILRKTFNISFGIMNNISNSGLNLYMLGTITKYGSILTQKSDSYLGCMLRTAIDNGMYSSIAENGWVYNTEVYCNINNIDTWSAGYQYNVGAIVYHSGSVYKCKVQNTGIIITNTSYWELVPCGVYTSISYKSGIPTYRPLLPTLDSSIKQMNRGMSVNTLNGISLVLPIYFFVLRDPQVLDNYSAIGFTNYVNYVNLYNISSGTKLDSYNDGITSSYKCFSIGYRRSNRKDIPSYLGIAIKQEG